MREDGRFGYGLDSDQIGILVPAVPPEGDPDLFLAYLAIPRDRAQWWTSLPLRPVGSEPQNEPDGRDYSFDVDLTIDLDITLPK